MEARRARSSAYPDKVPRGDWGRRIRFGEVDPDYTPDGEFYDAVARYREATDQGTSFVGGGSKLSFGGGGGNGN